jgi:quercetin dioxygenase-like cupin family protein
MQRKVRFDLTSQAKTFSRQRCPKSSSGSPSQRFPPTVCLAVIVGHPSEAGPYTIRVRVPRGVKLMPHRHPEDRVYTVMSGVFYIGLGDRFDPDKLQAYPPGSVIVLPGNTPHCIQAEYTRPDRVEQDRIGDDVQVRRPDHCR